MGASQSTANTSAADQPQQHSAPVIESPAGATKSDPQPKSAEVEEQTTRQQAGAQDGPAAAQGKAQKALQAVQEKPQTSTDPDAGDTHKGFGATDVGGGQVKDSEADKVVDGDTAGVNMGQAKASWLTKLLALMWPYISAGAEKQVWEMIPAMLEQNKPTWMTTLALKQFELGDVPPMIEDVKVFPGEDPGAEDIFMEFDFVWRGQQNVSLSLNPAPKVLQSIPLIKQIVDYTMSWSVGVEDITFKGRLRTTMIPMMFEMPCVGAIQVAFVDPPKLDFRLTLPAGSTESGLLRYVEGFLDSFISDNVLANYLLPDHYFSPIAAGAEDILTPEGVMEVRLIEAKNVPKMDLFGAGDPFAKLWLRPRSRKESCPKKGSDPQWTAEEATWAMPVHVRVHQVLTVSLLDKDVNGSDEIGRGHYNLGQLTPGKTEDLWIDIGVPTKQGQKENNTSTTRDKVVGAIVGAKGSHPSDVEGTAAHIQLTFRTLSVDSVKAINKVQMEGGRPSADLIKEQDVRHLVEKYDLMHEMFSRKDAGNKGTGAAAAEEAKAKQAK
ncbi:hypothetical protein WJX73_004159 [Symbiochloris irregularis]|uniref:C2 domain-containing protein n=1 Tax=Symbiochloris irregularis TaxID=706552 RepID=A0AAW1P0X8_9CHLO